MAINNPVFDSIRKERNFPNAIDLVNYPSLKTYNINHDKDMHEIGKLMFPVPKIFRKIKGLDDIKKKKPSILYKEKFSLYFHANDEDPKLNIKDVSINDSSLHFIQNWIVNIIKEYEKNVKIDYKISRRLNFSDNITWVYIF